MKLEGDTAPLRLLYLEKPMGQNPQLLRRVPQFLFGTVKRKRLL
jgi:hypothetical protein